MTGYFMVKHSFVKEVTFQLHFLLNATIFTTTDDEKEGKHEFLKDFTYLTLRRKFGKFINTVDSQ